MSARARWLGLSGALAGATLVLAGLAVAEAAPTPVVREPASALDVAVPASDTRLACPGPPASYAPAGSSGTGDATGDAAVDGSATSGVPATSLRVLALPSPAAAAPQRQGSAGSLVVSPLEDGDTPLGPSPRTAGDATGADAEEAAAAVVGAPLGDGGAVATADGGAPRGVVASPVAGTEPLVAGAALAAAGAGDLRGLATGPCVGATDEAWLVGGSTVVGDSTRLVLANPGTTTATVRARVLTDAGAATAAEAAGGPPPAVPELSLAPGERRSVLIEGVAPGAAALAAGVTSEGGDVSAWLVTTSLRGLVPQGVDVVTPGDAVGLRQVVPGLVVQRGDAPPVLRLAAPGEAPVVARWEVAGPSGPMVAEGPLATTVPAGGVVDVPLTGLGAGVHTVVVEGDGPLAAAALLRTSADPALAGDHAWTGSARPLAGPALVALPDAAGLPAEGGVPGTSSELVLHAPLAPDGSGAPLPDGGVAVAVLDASGRLSAPRAVDVTALTSGATVGLDVEDLATAAGSEQPVALVVTAPEGAGVVAGLRTGADADGGSRLVSAHAVAPPPASTGQVQVRLRGAP